jgi:hypothetical protein
MHPTARTANDALLAAARQELRACAWYLADNDMGRDRLGAHHYPIGKCGFCCSLIVSSSRLVVRGRVIMTLR